MNSEFFLGFGVLIGYFVVCAGGALLLRRFFQVPTEVFRKLLHLILVCSLLVWVNSFQTWWAAVLAAVVFLAAAYALLSGAEHIKGYSELLVERKRGEIKKSLVAVFFMFAVLLSVCWGWLGQKWLVLACVFAWGFGDGAAALVGKKFGRHYLEGKLIEGRKSVEGTVAMFIVSFIAVFIVLTMNRNAPWYNNAAIAFIAAAASAVVELYTLNGMDTITCPFAAAAVILPLVYVLGI